VTTLPKLLASGTQVDRSRPKRGVLSLGFHRQQSHQSASATCPAATPVVSAVPGEVSIVAALFGMLVAYKASPVSKAPDTKLPNVTGIWFHTHYW
jgi:hypothetical protein